MGLFVGTVILSDLTLTLVYNDTGSRARIFERDIHHFSSHNKQYPLRQSSYLPLNPGSSHKPSYLALNPGGSHEEDLNPSPITASLEPLSCKPSSLILVNRFQLSNHSPKEEPAASLMLMLATPTPTLALCLAQITTLLRALALCRLPYGYGYGYGYGYDPSQSPGLVSPTVVNCNPNAVQPVEEGYHAVQVGPSHRGSQDQG